MVIFIALVVCTVVVRNQSPVPTPDLHAFGLCVADTVNEQLIFFYQRAVQETPEEWSNHISKILQVMFLKTLRRLMTPLFLLNSLYQSPIYRFSNIFSTKLFETVRHHLHCQQQQ